MQYNKKIYKSTKPRTGQLEAKKKRTAIRFERYASNLHLDNYKLGILDTNCTILVKFMDILVKVIKIVI